MLSFTHAIFRGLQEDLRASLKQLPFSTPSVLRNGLLEAHLKLSDNYYKMDQSPYYTWAARESDYCLISALLNFLRVLDPRISYEGLRADFGGNGDLLLQLEASKMALNEHFKANYALRKSNVVPVIPPVASSLARLLGSPQKDFTARYRVQQHAVLDKLREYYGLPREDLLRPCPMVGSP